MAVLAFDVQANYEEAQRLTVELRSLEAQLKKTTAATDPKVVQQLQTQLASTRTQLNGIVKDAALAGSALKGFGTEVGILKNNLMGLKNMMLGGAGLGALATQIVKVRGEFQQYEVAFETMLGSAKKAKDMMRDMEEFAVHTPFTMPQVVQGAKQLMAYGEEAEDVIDTLRHLGDVAAGLSLPVQRLVNLYGSVLAQGKVSGLTLRRAMMAGIPITEELAKVMGKTAAEVKGLVTAGKVGANEFRQAIWNMSSEGGKFFNLMDKQAKTVSGQISNIGVALHGMFNAIGESNEGVINSAVGGVAKLVENYETVGKVMLATAATFGTYKAAMMAVVAMNNLVSASEEQINIKREKALTDAVAEAGGYAIYGEKVETVIAAKQQEKMTIEQVVIAKRQEMQMDLAGEQARVKYLTTQEASLIAQKQELEATKAQIVERQTLLNQQFLNADSEEAMAISTEASTLAIQRQNVETQLNTVATELNNIETQKKAAVEQVAATQTALNTFNQKTNTIATVADTSVKRIWTAVTMKAANAARALSLAIKANPIGIALTAVSTILMGLLTIVPLFSKKSKEANDVTEQLAEQTKKETSELQALYETLKTAENGTNAHTKAIETFNKKAKDYNTALLKENDTIEEQTRKYNELTDAIKASTAAKIVHDKIENAKNDEQDYVSNRIKQLRKSAKKISTQDAGQAAFSVNSNISDYSKSKESEMFWAILETQAQDFDSRLESITEESEAEDLLTKYRDGIVQSMGKLSGATESELAQFSQEAERALREIRSKHEEGKALIADINATYATMNLSGPQGESGFSYKKGQYGSMTYDELVAERKKIEGKKTKDRYNDGDIAMMDMALEEIAKREAALYTSGSLESLNRRMKEAKSSRDAIDKAADPEGWKRENEKIKKLQPIIKKLQASGAENAGKTGKQYAQYNEKVRQEEIKKERKLVDQEREMTQARIDAMEEGSEKTLAQIDLDYQKEDDAIMRWYEDLKEEKIKSAKALWEANPAHKDVPFTYDPADYEATEEENELFYQKILASFTKYSIKKRDAQIEENEAMREYLKDYGTIEEQRLAIEESYNDKILQAKTEGEKKRLRQEKKTALLEVDNTKYQRLSEYGNQSERRQAIEFEYAKEMVEAGSDEEKMRLAYEKRKRAIEELNTEFIEAYGSIEQRRQELSDDWDRQIAKITDKDQQGIAKLQKQAELLKFDMEHSENEGNLFGWSKEELEKSIAYVETQLKGMDKSTEKAQQLIEMLDKLKSSAASVNDWDGTLQGFLENFGKISPKEFKERWGKMTGDEKKSFLGESAATFAGYMQDSAGYMRDIADASGDVKLAEMADTVEGIGGMLGSIGQGFAQGGFIGAAVAAVGSLLANTAEAFANYKAELKQLEDDTKEYAKSVEMASFQLNGEYESIFGTDKLAIIHEYYSDATRALNGYKDAVKGLANSEVRTYSAHWFERMMGGEHEFTKVKNLIPNLFDSAGNVVLENLESALDSISNLDDAANAEVKKQMEDARDYLTAYKDAMDNLRSSVSEMFGSLADSLGDALVNAVRSGTDAFYDLNKVGTDVVNNLERQMVSGIFKTFLDKYQKEIIDKVGNNGSEEDLLEIYGKMFGELETVIPAAQKAATRFEELAYAKGFDVRQNQNADASSSSYQNISESTGQALEGRFTAIQIQTTMMYGKLEEISMNDVARNRMIDDIRQIQADALVELRAINENTQSVVKPIANMASLISSIKQKVDTL